MESDTMELLRLMLAHLRPRLQGRDEEWQALERKQQELMAASGKPTAGTCRCWRRSWRWRTPGLARENGPAPPTSFWGCKWAWTWGS